MKVALILAMIFLTCSFVFLVALYRKGIARKGGLTILFLPCIMGVLQAVRALDIPDPRRFDLILVAVWVALVATGIPVLYLDDRRARRKAEPGAPLSDQEPRSDAQSG